jgi:hypothetical protein
MIIIGVLVLLNIIGYNEMPVSGTMYKIIAGNQSGGLPNYNETAYSGLSGTESNAFWVKLLGILTLVAAVGVVASLFTRTPPTDYIAAGFVALFGAALLVDLIYIFGLFWSFGMPYNMFGMLIFAPLIGGLIVSLYEWWRFG